MIGEETKGLSLEKFKLAANECSEKLQWCSHRTAEARTKEENERYAGKLKAIENKFAQAKRANIARYEEMLKELKAMKKAEDESEDPRRVQR